MYTSNKISAYSRLGQSDPLYNPPAYYQTMATDLTQVPTQIYPYGGGGFNPYGPYYGFKVGQRTFEQEDIDRENKRRADAMIRRAQTSDDPTHKYITAQGLLNPKAAAALKAAQIEAAKRKQPDIVGSFQKRILLTVLLGAIVSSLLK